MIHTYSGYEKKVKTDLEQKSMHRLEMIRMVAKETGIEENETKIIVDKFLEVMRRELKKGKRIQIDKFGSFEKVVRKARSCKVPTTGIVYDVPAHHDIKFWTHQPFRESLNE